MSLCLSACICVCSKCNIHMCLHAHVCALSLIYVSKVVGFYEMHGFDVTRHSDDNSKSTNQIDKNSIDTDFVYLASAKYLVQGGGGFSALAAACARRANATVLYPNVQ